MYEKSKQIFSILPPSFTIGASGWSGSGEARANMRPIVVGCLFTTRAATAKNDNIRTKPQNKNKVKQNSKPK